MENKITALLDNWKKRNIEGIYCQTKEQVAQKILELIPKEASVGISGSETLTVLNIVTLLQQRGTKVFNQYKEGLSRGEALEMRREGVNADFYLASPNAIAESGELVFFSAYGNRTAGVANGKTVIVIASTHKIAPTIQEALTRARCYATPLNCKRLNWQTPCLKDGVCRQDLCVFPQYKRMCCQVLILEAEVMAGRLKVILVDEAIGF